MKKKQLTLILALALALLLVVAIIAIVIVMGGDKGKDRDNDRDDDYESDDGESDDEEDDDGGSGDGGSGDGGSGDGGSGDGYEPSENLLYKHCVNEYDMPEYPEEYYVVTGTNDGKNASCIVIPDTYQGLPVCGISNSAFESFTYLTTVIIPDTVVTIGSSAFLGCELLETIDLPSSLKVIGDYAFWFSGLRSIHIPSKVEIIQEYAFMNSRLEKVTFNSDAVITDIGNNAFINCHSLKEITIPASVLTIGDEAFANCEALKKATLDCVPWEMGSQVFSGCTALTELVLAEGFTSLPLSTFANSGLEAQLETVGGVIYYGDRAVSVDVSDRREAYTIREGTRVICDSAFEKEKLVSIVLPNSLTVIGKYCFMNCNKLAQVQYGNGLQTIMQSAFYGCSALDEVVLPDSVSTVEMYAFEDTGYLDNRNNWDDILVPNEGYRMQCILYLDKILLTASFANIPSITVKDGTELIASEAISSLDRLETLVLPDGVKILNREAINFCDNLKEIYLGSGIERIDEYAINTLASLTDIYYNGTKAEWQAIDKDANWLYYHCDVTIHLSDGDIFVESDMDDAPW